MRRLVARLFLLWLRVRYGKLYVGIDVGEGWHTTVLVAYRNGRYRVLRATTQPTPGHRNGGP